MGLDNTVQGIDSLTRGTNVWSDLTAATNAIYVKEMECFAVWLTLAYVFFFKYLKGGKQLYSNPTSGSGRSGWSVTPRLDKFTPNVNSISLNTNTNLFVSSFEIIYSGLSQTYSSLILAQRQAS